MDDFPAVHDAVARGGWSFESPHPDHGSSVVVCCRASGPVAAGTNGVNTITIDGETRVVGQFAGRLFLQEAWLPHSRRAMPAYAQSVLATTDEEPT